MISDFLEKSSDLGLRHSKIESDRFGISIARLNVSINCSASDTEIVKVCKESSANLLILRVPSSRIRLACELAEISNKIAFQADTLVYFSKNLKSIVERRNKSENLKLVTASSDDEARVIDLARVVFRDYPNHYQSNRALDSKLILEGYIEWASNGVNDQKKLTVIIEDQNSNAIAFALVAFGEEGAEIELNGVHPDFQNQGVYSALLESLMAQLANQKVANLSISTQIQNTRVIRAWIKAGFILDFSLNTYHLIAREY
jgi:ribosomal protein S18 acetylase RimI-like enzyme